MYKKCPECRDYEECPKCEEHALYCNSDKEEILVTLGFVAVGVGLYYFIDKELFVGILIIIIGAVSLRRGFRLPRKVCKNCDYKVK